MPSPNKQAGTETEQEERKQCERCHLNLPLSQFERYRDTAKLKGTPTQNCDKCRAVVAEERKRYLSSLKNLNATAAAAEEELELEIDQAPTDEDGHDAHPDDLRPSLFHGEVAPMPRQPNPQIERAFALGLDWSYVHNYARTARITEGAVLGFFEQRAQIINLRNTLETQATRYDEGPGRSLQFMNAEIQRIESLFLRSGGQDIRQASIAWESPWEASYVPPTGFQSSEFTSGRAFPSRPQNCFNADQRDNRFSLSYSHSAGYRPAPRFGMLSYLSQLRSRNFRDIYAGGYPTSPYFFSHESPHDRFLLAEQASFFHQEREPYSQMRLPAPAYIRNLHQYGLGIGLNGPSRVRISPGRFASRIEPYPQAGLRESQRQGSALDTYLGPQHNRLPSDGPSSLAQQHQYDGANGDSLGLSHPVPARTHQQEDLFSRLEREAAPSHPQVLSSEGVAPVPGEQKGTLPLPEEFRYMRLGDAGSGDGEMSGSDE